VLDEVQTMPELFPVLRVLADQREGKARFLILGSASPELMRRSSESLAGRVEFVDLHGFDIGETGSHSARPAVERIGTWPRLGLE
jgi:predicted AAA+ superfamily ATPase